MDVLEHKGENAAVYILYPLRVAAKVELSMLGTTLLNKYHIFNFLRERCISMMSWGERLYDSVERKQ